MPLIRESLLQLNKMIRKLILRYTAKGKRHQLLPHCKNNGWLLNTRFYLFGEQVRCQIFVSINQRSMDNGLRTPEATTFIQNGTENLLHTQQHHCMYQVSEYTAQPMAQYKYQSTPIHQTTTDTVVTQTTTIL